VLQDPAKCARASVALDLLRDYLALSAAPSLPFLIMRSCSPFFEQILAGLGRANGRDANAIPYLSDFDAWSSPVVKLLCSVVALYNTLLERCQVCPRLSVSY
jgi:hypothetical protein